jgi:hypothetical protein
MTDSGQHAKNGFDLGGSGTTEPKCRCHVCHHCGQEAELSLSPKMKEPLILFSMTEKQKAKGNKKEMTKGGKK